MNESQQIVSQIKEVIIKDKELFEVISDMVSIMERMDKDNKDDDEVCKRCDMDVNECECWELDAIEEMMRDD